jgi:metal-responsive CopG/Arc/MetJ family transcriptional regulator
MKRYDVRLSDELVAKIDDWRRLQPDLPTRAETIRRLTELGLAKDELGLAKTLIIQRMLRERTAQEG